MLIYKPRSPGIYDVEVFMDWNTIEQFFNDVSERLSWVGPIMVAISALMMLPLTVRAFTMWRKAKAAGHASQGELAWYVRMPMLLPAMVACYVILLVSGSALVYLVIGVLWGISLPVRFKVTERLTGTSSEARFTDGALWGFAAVLAMIHGMWWPISVPALYFIGNEVHG